MTLYFSLIAPARGNERGAALERARGPYGDHQWLWTFFPAPRGTVRDFLFRRVQGDGMPMTYALSSRPAAAPSPNWHVQNKPFAPLLHEGQRLRFDLRANPVISTRNESGSQARHDVVMREKKRLLSERGLMRWDEWHGGDKPPLHKLIQASCADWLLARAPRLGFDVDADTLSVEGYTQHRGKKGEIQFSSVDFSGELTVTDAAGFRSALGTGIGHAKAFGCGLMLIRPLG